MIYMIKDEVDQDNKLIIKIWGLVGEKADNIRAMLDGTRFKSLMITNQKADSQTITIEGKGNGHRVGLSQFGANSMASKVIAYTDTLSFYYPGVSLVSHYTDKFHRITVPNPAQVNPIMVGDTKISGTAKPNSTFYVKVWPDTIATGKIDSTGNFSFEVPKQEAGTMLLVLVKGQGSYNTYTKVYVKFDDAPEAPTVNSITNQDTKITGSTEPNPTIHVKV